MDDTKLFKRFFSQESLMELFVTRFSQTTIKGTDRLNGFQFCSRAAAELAIASAKCINGTYRFAPYLEVLKTKGRNKPPRLIGIPTVRDRIILAKLNQFLANLYSDQIPSCNIANTYVRIIAKDFTENDNKEIWICSADIKTFYDAITRDKLLAVLQKKIKCKAALSLIHHALLTPTVPKNTRRSYYAKEYRQKKGVPQGLAISNILASIYMQPIDEGMKKFDLTYHRYVDDVLMYGNREIVENAYRSLNARLKRRGLALHPLGSSKSQIKRFGEPFSYLGYYFTGNKITVRDSTIERFLQSIAARFSDFKHNKAHRLDKFKYLTEARLAEIFLLELNEQITGAIKEKKRYGWIAYFNQINDLSLLHQLDHTIRSMFTRLSEFHRAPPSNLRSLRRAYWEMRFNPNGGYIMDYDKIDTWTKKLKYLEKRGRIAPSETLTDEQIEAKYHRYVLHILSRMHADEGANYG